MEIRPQTPPPSWKVRQVRDADGVHVVDVEPAARPVDGTVPLRSLPALLAEDLPPSPERYEEVLVSDKALSKAAREHLEQAPQAKAWPGSEVRTLVQQGPKENRIDLTIVGDGYQAEEKDRFFADAQRMTDDLFREKTFHSYLPLFNVHAVFVPSKDSGISDVEEKDTALGLYRSPQGSKRAIMPGNYGNIESALDLAPDNDYPILMANDDFYGGLGGRYAITTRSENSGSMVLRHELGHNFGDVGEEYDGGQVYDGANHSPTANVPWAKWVEGDKPPHVGKASNLAGSYPWKNLKDGPVTVRFDVPRNPENAPVKLGVDISSVGWQTPEDVAILIDGQEQPARGVYTDDRSFFRLDPNLKLAPGRHTLEIREKKADGDNVLASVRISGFEPDYDFTPNLVGAFPSFASGGRQAGYRPTHESCLMRDMRSMDFCSVDRENMWHRFLERVSLIDALGVEDGKVRLRTPALPPATAETPGLAIQWFRVAADGTETEVPELAGRSEWPVGDAKGRYRAQVTFATDEVRTPTDRFTASRTLTL